MIHLKHWKKCSAQQNQQSALLLFENSCMFFFLSTRLNPARKLCRKRAGSISGMLQEGREILTKFISPFLHGYMKHILVFFRIETRPSCLSCRTDRKWAPRFAKTAPRLL